MIDAKWPSNPYDFSAPAASEAFAGRSGELDALDRFVRAIGQGRVQHLLIHGPRAIGKTSLVRRLEERLDRGTEPYWV